MAAKKRVVKVEDTVEDVVSPDTPAPIDNAPVPAPDGEEKPAPKRKEWKCAGAILLSSAPVKWSGASRPECGEAMPVATHPGRRGKPAAADEASVR